MSLAEPLYSLSGKRVWIAGHRGMVGSALVRRLAAESCEILTIERSELDLTEAAAVKDWMAEQRPHAVFVAAAKVGGILANDTYPADFIYQNLMIATNIVDGAHRCDVEKLMVLGSSCLYPKHAAQPMAEEALLTGSLEPTNEWYAVAKIAGIKMAQAYRKQHGRDFIAAMPTNLYGPNDNFDLQNSHVLPAMIRKAHEAKLAGANELVIWGSGTPRREFLHVDDLADACVFLMQHYSAESHVNVGSGQEISIYDLAILVCKIVGFSGAIVKDTTKPDGAPRKLLIVDTLHSLGWSAPTQLEDGIARSYAAFLSTLEDNRVMP